MLPPFPPNHPSVSLSFFSSHYFFLLFHSLPTGCGARSASLWVHRNLFWQLSRDGNLHGSNMLHVTIADQKPSFGTLRRMSDAVVGRGNAWWQEWTSLPMPELLTWASCRKDWKKISTEWAFMPPPSPTPQDPIGQGTEVNGTLRTLAEWTLIFMQGERKFVQSETEEDSKQKKKNLTINIFARCCWNGSSHKDHQTESFHFAAATQCRSVIYKLIHWCIELSQPRGIISGLN